MQHGQKVSLRRLDREPPTLAEWTRAAQLLGTARPLVSVRSRRVRALGISPEVMDDGELLSLLVAEPAVAKRPLLLSETAAVAGFDALAYQRLIEVV